MEDEYVIRERPAKPMGLADMMIGTIAVMKVIGMVSKGRGI